MSNEPRIHQEIEVQQEQNLELDQPGSKAVEQGSTIIDKPSSASNLLDPRTYYMVAVADKRGQKTSEFFIDCDDSKLVPLVTQDTTVQELCQLFLKTLIDDEFLLKSNMKDEKVSLSRSSAHSQPLAPNKTLLEVGLQNGESLTLRFEKINDLRSEALRPKCQRCIETFKQVFNSGLVGTKEFVRIDCGQNMPPNQFKPPYKLAYRFINYTVFEDPTVSTDSLFSFIRSLPKRDQVRDIQLHVTFYPKPLSAYYESIPLGSNTKHCLTVTTTVVAFFQDGSCGNIRCYPATIDLDKIYPDPLPVSQAIGPPQFVSPVAGAQLSNLINSKLIDRLPRTVNLRRLIADQLIVPALADTAAYLKLPPRTGITTLPIELIEQVFSHLDSSERKKVLMAWRNLMFRYMNGQFRTNL